MDAASWKVDYFGWLVLLVYGFLEQGFWDGQEEGPLDGCLDDFTNGWLEGWLLGWINGSLDGLCNGQDDGAGARDLLLGQWEGRADEY